MIELQNYMSDRKSTVKKTLKVTQKEQKPVSELTFT